MKFAKIPASNFDLEKTLNSGQVFHWEKAGCGFVGTVGDSAIFVEQANEMLKVRFGEWRLTQTPYNFLIRISFVIRHSSFDIIFSL